MYSYIKYLKMKRKRQETESCPKRTKFMDKKLIRDIIIGDSAAVTTTLCIECGRWSTAIRSEKYEEILKSPETFQPHILYEALNNIISKPPNEWISALIQLIFLFCLHYESSKDFSMLDTIEKAIMNKSENWMCYADHIGYAFNNRYFTLKLINGDNQTMQKIFSISKYYKIYPYYIKRQPLDLIGYRLYAPRIICIEVEKSLIGILKSNLYMKHVEPESFHLFALFIWRSGCGVKLARQIKKLDNSEFPAYLLKPTLKKLIVGSKWATDITIKTQNNES
jgi:hypothetical protein